MASLRGSKELVIYEDPLKEIIHLCSETKKVIELYSQGIPEDLPISINTDVAQEIFLRSAKNDWTQKKKSILKEKRDNIITKILKGFTTDEKYEKYVRKELEELKETQYEFLIELVNLSKSKRKKRLDEWSSYELEGVFEQVELPSNNTPKKTKLPSKKDELDRFIVRFLKQDYDNQFKETRDLQARILERLFKRNKRAPKGYKGKNLPVYQYIRTKFLPFLVFIGNKGNLTTVLEEDKIYKVYKTNIY